MYIDPVTKLSSGDITCVLSMLNITKCSKERSQIESFLFCF